MNTPFKIPSKARSRVGVLGIGMMLMLAGCILQGPWDFTPQNQTIFQGIWASGYAVAGNPANNVCFERLIPLSQGSTDAFPFYDSAQVRIDGTFSTGVGPLLLHPLYDTPDCFSGDSTVHFLTGQVYALTARFVWDSSGSEVSSILTATATVPNSFGITDSAGAPALAKTGLSQATLFDPNIYMKLPPIPRAQILTLYGDTLNALASDTAARNAYLSSHGSSLAAQAALLLQKDLISYGRGDTVFYIGGSGQFNNLSHFYHSVRSSDVAGVLVTQRIDTLGEKPTTSLTGILGLKPDSSKFYRPGDIHTLSFYQSALHPNGSNVLDSIGVVNASFWIGLNRLYFYGVEKVYSDYILTNGGQAAANPKIVPTSNVTGGKGFFAGMVLDSFDVNVKLDSTTQAYSEPAVRAVACRDQGWFSSRDCAGYYHQFCSETDWASTDCHLDAIYTCLDPTQSTTAPAGLCDSASTYAASDSALNLEATRRYCIDHDYPANVAGCASVQNECVTGSLANGCQLILWQSCDLDYWKPAACVEGRQSYCREYDATEQELCHDVGN
jgi:hypothetical protein